jgi:endonuclease YncB( thermonuclease family)
MTTLALISGLVASTISGIAVAAPSRALSPAAPAAYADIPLQETGTVVEVLDGDTFIFRDESSREVFTVRLIGVNTPEVTGPQNIHFAADQCGGRPAEALLEQTLPKGTRVQLRSGRHDSTNRGRSLRYAFAYNSASLRYDIDVQSIIASSGLALWFSLDEEAALSHPYRLIIDRAQAEGRGIWNPAYCGPIEQPSAQLTVVVNWDAPGNDNLNINGEFVVVRNTGAIAVDVSGWLLRDSSLTSWFHFPGGSVLQPGDFRVVHSGVGTPGVPNARHLYMGSTVPLFPNTEAGKFLGDGAYLLDRNTAMRFYDEYPCLSDCVDPLQGKVRITEVNAKSHAKRPARRANEEYVVITNLGATSALMDGYYLRRKVSTYPFLANTVIPPGRSVTVRIGQGAFTATTQYWGQPSTLLSDAADSVSLLSNKNVLISRVGWTRPTASGIHR